MRSRYGLEPNEYEAMFVQQNNRCAICGKEGGETKGSRLYVDHNHLTKKVRKLLCCGCNTFVGYVEKNPDKLETVLEYLKKHN